jgi:hypothetical protein
MVLYFFKQTKAFGRVEWDWLDICLKRYGIGDKFRKWIQMCLVGLEIAIQTNGFISVYFQISCSIKQDCPIAPFLYILQWLVQKEIY